MEGTDYFVKRCRDFQVGEYIIIRGCVCRIISITISH